jgi:hypothetical protein
MKPLLPSRASVQKALSLLGILLCVPTFAQDAKIRAHVEAPDPLWAGEKVTLVIELLVPGYFSSAPGFDLPDPAGLILLPAAEHPVVSGETIDGVYYVTQRHELAVYPARAGERTIPPFQVRLAFKRSPLDHDDVAAVVTTPPLSLKVTTPPGAEGLGQVISARNLQVVEEWKPLPGKGGVKAGDAFTRTITFSAPGVPGMVFPPFPANQIDGLRLYPKQPALLDNGAAELSGGRRDTIVYVCERPGTFVIPAVRLTWWDLATKQLRTADLPVHTIVVNANPALATRTPTPAQFGAGGMGRWLFVGGGALLGLVLAARWRAGLGRICHRLIAPMRPTHLQPLNPAAPARAASPPR